MAVAATKRKTYNKFDTIKNLKEDFLTCGICLDYFNNPKSLKCLHKFCETCLQAYVDKLSIKVGNKFQCPMKCKEYTTLPRDGIKGLKTDFILKGLDEFLSVKETERKSEKRSVKDVFGVGENEVRCSDHDGKICELYCEEENCKVPVCTKCMSTEHNGHRVSEIEIVLQNSKGVLNDLIKAVEYEIILAEERSSFSNKMLEEMEESAKELSTNLDNHLEEIIKKIRQRAVQLKDEVKTKVTNQVSKLKRQTEDNEKRTDALKVLQGDIAQGASQSISKDLIKMKQNSQAKLQELRQDENPDPITMVHMRIENNIDLMNDDLLELIVKERRFRVIGEDGDIVAQEIENEESDEDNDNDSLENQSYDTSTDEDEY